MLCTKGLALVSLVTFDSRQVNGGMLVNPDSIADDAKGPFFVRPGAGHELTLTLSLKVNHTHIDNGSQISESLHGLYIRVAVVNLYIQLRVQTRNGLNVA